MLPDFPVLKQKLFHLLMLGAKLETLSHDPVLSSIGRTVMHEGNRPILVRHDGSIHDEGLTTATATFEIKIEEVENISLNDLFYKFCDTLNQIREQEAKMMFNGIKEVTESVGNVRNMKGEPFNMDVFFEMLEMIDIDFDQQGRPRLPTIVTGTELFNTIKPILERSESDPKYKQRFEEIINRKREEWRVRESNRKLVG